MLLRETDFNKLHCICSYHLVNDFALLLFTAQERVISSIDQTNEEREEELSTLIIGPSRRRGGVSSEVVPEEDATCYVKRVQSNSMTVYLLRMFAFLTYLAYFSIFFMCFALLWPY